MKHPVYKLMSKINNISNVKVNRIKYITILQMILTSNIFDEERLRNFRTSYTRTYYISNVIFLISYR